MAGDTANAASWANADVYTASKGTAGPTDVSTAWAVAWTAVGLLDGEEGFTQGREDEVTEHFAWGGLLVKKTKTKHQRTIKFVALEDNEAVFTIVNPGSTRSQSATTGDVTSTVKVPVPYEFAIGFELRDGDKVKRRTVKRAEVQEIGEVKEAESELTVYEITVVIYPEPDGTLFTEISGSPAAMATGATAGTPGAFTPAGREIPRTLTDLQGASIIASPTTAWTAGQHVRLGNGSKAHWSGTAWAAGQAA